MTPLRLYGSGHPPETQREALVDGDVPVAVYGLGKMGLPLAAVYAETTGNTVGVDVDESVVAAVERGECHIEREPGLAGLVADQVHRGRLRATSDAGDAAAAATLHVVIVPTTLTEARTPDLSQVRAVVRAVAEGLDPGDAVLAESTLPPGTCRDVLVPLLERESGVDRDAFGVAFCPERTSSGRALQDIRGAYPKVVGGVDPESTRVAELVYGELTANEVVPVADATTAEAVKLFEGVYRDVNIALANELATLDRDLGIDVNAAIAAANTQPFCDIHDPGPGVGGHCIPYYPYFVMDAVERSTPLVRTARDVNDGMPAFTVDLLEAALADAGEELRGADVVVLGIAYRPGVAETRKTPAAAIIDLLDERGATVFAADPLVADVGSFGAEPVAVEAVAETDADAVVLVTPHEEFERIDWDGLEDVVLVDGRGAVDPGETRHRVVTIGGGR